MTSANNVACMKRMGAAQFKQSCLSVLDHLDRDGLVITKHNRPVAKVIPILAEPQSLIGALKRKIKVKGDIFSTGLEWCAES